jgi:hypothetical protein
MSKKIYIGEYHDSNPKIDVFANGVYQYSTNYFTRCKDAKLAFELRIDSAGGNPKDSNVKAYKAK